ncbi:MAG: polysaccharide biosynthesis/export family protein [Xanthomonadaceae bacterium]|nr:polysaccharide biosynthesis/export family protein [Xanthomonadaceae bacterium]
MEVNRADAVPAAPEPAAFQPLPTDDALDITAIAPGDVLGVSLYELGVRIFSAGPAANSDSSFDPAAKNQQIGPLEVTREGTIRLPYVGVIFVAGMRPRDVEREIEARMAGRSEYPQVIVRQEAAFGSAVIVGGEVSNPGRFRLTPAHEKLLDVITLAGGYRGAGMSDLVVRVLRRGQISEAPLEGLDYSNGGGMEMEPGDRVEVLRRPRSYSVMGTANRVNRYDLPTRQVSLIEALALSGGPNDNLADPAAVFLFRYVKTPDGEDRPIVYHLNMMKPASYFLAQKFILENKDVIYVAGARANEPTKLLQVIGQVFTPFLLIKGAIN